MAPAKPKLMILAVAYHDEAGIRVSDFIDVGVLELRDVTPKP